MTTEEERAALWRQQQRNRERYRRLVNTRMKGDPARARAFKEAWEPLTNKGVQRANRG